MRPEGTWYFPIFTPATVVVLQQLSQLAAPWPPAPRRLRGPPQSPSVSVPSCTPSSQTRVWRFSAAGSQPSLAPSSRPAHARPSVPFGWPVPPQPMSVSTPFFPPSELVGAWHL